VSVRNNFDVAVVAAQFQFDGEVLDYKPFGNGHLHDTFLVRTGNAHPPGLFVLQRINHLAFKNPPLLMENISRISGHLRKKLASRYAEEELARRVLTVVPTRDGRDLFNDDAGNFWRVYVHINNTCSYDVIDDADRLYEAAFMFGQFLDLVGDLPLPPLHETIRAFHDGQVRFTDFKESAAADCCNRGTQAAAEIDFVFKHAGLFQRIPALITDGKIPLRPTHNDTKVNNVLLDSTDGKGVCVIDLDTVMYGTALYDFGDLVRTALSSRAEDERDLVTVFVEPARYKVLVNGFLAGAGNGLNEAECAELVFGAEFMPLIIGTRFLTDFLRGDTYFKVHRPGQNLDRCRRQFKLLESIMENEDLLKAITMDAATAQRARAV